MRSRRAGHPAGGSGGIRLPVPTPCRLDEISIHRVVLVGVQGGAVHPLMGAGGARAFNPAPGRPADTPPRGPPGAPVPADRWRRTWQDRPVGGGPARGAGLGRGSRRGGLVLDHGLDPDSAAAPSWSEGRVHGRRRRRLISLRARREATPSSQWPSSSAGGSTKIATHGPSCPAPGRGLRAGRGP